MSSPLHAASLRRVFRRILAGALFLVRGSTSAAFRMGVTPLVVGLTIVAFGTGSPEFAVSVGSAIDGNPALALGNVVGSNISNIALILGVAAMIRPLKAVRGGPAGNSADGRIHRVALDIAL